MRYAIEYLSGAPGKRSVCSTVMCNASLAAAALQARVGSTDARIHHHANGFRIREQSQRGDVMIEESFWGFASP
jgi:hypothetical protein